MPTAIIKSFGVAAIATLLATGSALAADNPKSPDATPQSGASSSKGSPAAQTREGKIRNTSKDCAALSGKQYDECIQATPAGPADLRTGEGSKAKSEVAVERQEQKAQEDGGNAVPSQSKDTVGHPEQAGTTGEAQTLKEPGAGRSQR